MTLGPLAGRPAPAGPLAAAPRLVTRARRLPPRQWALVRCADLRIDDYADAPALAVEIFGNGLDPAAVRVEPLAHPTPGGDPRREEGKGAEAPIGSSGGRVSRAAASGARPARHSTVRAISYRSGAAVPLESSRVRGQR